MRVSQRLDYGLRGMIALAALPPGSSVAAGDIADRLGLPRRFVEQQFTSLSKRGLVRCQRGAGGGCALARPAGSITVGEIVRAVQGSVLDVPRVSGSAASEMWAGVAEDLETSLDAITLSELASRQRHLDETGVFIYHI